MKTTKKILLVSVILLTLVVSPQITSAQYLVYDPITEVNTGITAGFTGGNFAKETFLDWLAYTAANIAIQQISAQTVNWINSGFKGSPAYVTNPGQFFLGIADNQLSSFLSETNLSALCTPFKANVRIALVRNYLAETNNKVYSCTLSKIANNYENFMQDFSQGGWDGWYEVTQNDQNNPYGSYLDAQNKLNVEIGNKTVKYQNQLNWGKGIFSWEKCKEENVLTQDDINNGYGDEGYAAGDCYDDGTGDNKETYTPGSVIEGQLNKTLGLGSDRLVAADEIDEIITALFNQLVGRVIGGIGNGLRGSSEDGYTTSLQGASGSDKPRTDVSSVCQGCPPAYSGGGNNGGVNNGDTVTCVQIDYETVCTTTPGGGDTSTESHAECRDNACVGVDGPGENMCSNDAECGG